MARLVSPGGGHVDYERLQATEAVETDFPSRRDDELEPGVILSLWRYFQPCHCLCRPLGFCVLDVGGGPKSNGHFGKKFAVSTNFCIG